MDAIIEKFLDLQPFGWLLQRMGIGEKWSAFLSIVLITLIVAGITALCKSFIQHFKNLQAALEDIKPQFDHFSIKKAKRFYIQTQYQNASPARQEEPGFTHKYIARDQLIPFFTDTAFNEEIESERFYLILADSGMGKTTFMINLYLHYTSCFQFSGKKNDMKLFRFSNPDTIEQIKAITQENAKKTILLLDALDEDLGIISTDPAVSDAQAFQKRIDEIIEITRNFREVVITCRTQYFPGQEEDPYELKIKRPDERGLYTLNKLYISPFNEKEVKRYLNKKFGVLPFINQKKKRKALKIVSKSRNLVMRPMLLSYIDYLIEDEMVDVNSCNIYETLVAKWLLREAEKRKGSVYRSDFINNLRDLSTKLAIAIHANWKKEGSMSVSKEEAVDIARQYNIALKPEEITGQSLLTCDGVGNWKFAHKSIFEFFLAKEAVRHTGFLREMNFKGMDMARKFYEELNPKLVMVDRVEILNMGWKDYTDEVPPFFIYNKVINNRDFRSLFAIPRAQLDDGVLIGAFSLRDVITYCNKMNVINGYPPAYHLSPKRIVPEELVIENMDHFRGFRLPTAEELKNYFLSRFLSQNPVPADYIIKQGRKQFAGIALKVDAKYVSTSNDLDEWCVGDRGISGICREKFISLVDGTAKNIIDDSVVAIPGHHVERRTLSARLVFIP